MSDSGDFNDNSVDSVENEENNNVKSDKKKEKKEVNQMSNVMNNNNSDKSDDFQIENNEDESNKQNLKDSSEDIINNNNNSNNKNEIKEIPERQLLNLNKDNSSFSSFNSEKKKDAIILEVDEEKTKRNNFTVYQLIEIKQDSNSYNKKTKKILCYRRYSEFDKFYNKLKSRYPHCIFPRLSQKLYIKKEDPINVENRRKELQYFLNRLYYHEEISKSEEFKRFINSTFDAQYFDNLPNKYSYPESFKANNDQSYWNFGIKK